MFDCNHKITKEDYKSIMDCQVKNLNVNKAKIILNCIQQLIISTESLHNDLKQIESELRIIKLKLSSSRTHYSRACQKTTNQVKLNHEAYTHIMDIESLEWDKLCYESNRDKKLDEEIKCIEKIMSLRSELEELNING